MDESVQPKPAETLLKDAMRTARIETYMSTTFHWIA